MDFDTLNANTGFAVSSIHCVADLPCHSELIYVLHLEVGFTPYASLKGVSTLFIPLHHSVAFLALPAPPST